MMDLDHFWDLIEQARRTIDASQGPEGNPLLSDEDALGQVLATLTPEEVIQFDHRFTERLYAAYHWDLWAALAVIEGAYGDDAFEHFRAELILLGRGAFEAALRDADSLADAGPLPWGMEGLIYLPARVYEAKSGNEFPYDAKWDELPHPDEPAGLPWEDEDLPARLPRLWARFHDGDTAESDAPSVVAPVGPRVRVIDGHLRSHEGVLVGTDESAGEVTVTVSLFGRPTKVVLKKTQIEMM
jgi:hypothetical protein